MQYQIPIIIALILIIVAVFIYKKRYKKGGKEKNKGKRKKKERAKSKRNGRGSNSKSVDMDDEDIDDDVESSEEENDELVDDARELYNLVHEELAQDLEFDEFEQIVGDLADAEVFVALSQEYQEARDKNMDPLKTVTLNDYIRVLRNAD